MYREHEEVTIVAACIDAVTRLVLTSTNCPKHTRLGETERTWAKLEILTKVGDLDYDCDYEQ